MTDSPHLSKDPQQAATPAQPAASATWPAPVAGLPMPVGTSASPSPAVPQARGMYTAAAIINWVVFGILVVSTLGVGVIAGAWFIPMTIRMHKDAKGPYKHTALGVCTLLFCNIISGILILVDDSGRPSSPVA